MKRKLFLGIIVYIVIQFFSSCEKDLASSSEIRTISFPQETYYIRVGEKKTIHIYVSPKVGSVDFKYKCDEEYIQLRPIFGRGKIDIIGKKVGIANVDIVSSKEDFPLLENEGKIRTRVIVTN